MGKFGRTWALMKSSAGILKQDKELMLFPVLSGIFTLLLVASFVVPLFGSDMLDNMDEGSQGEQLFYLGLFAFYVFSYFIVIFFNSAIIACALIRMEGGDPTVKDGLDAAVSRLPQIFSWAIVAGTVGFILRMIEERSALAGQIIAAVLGVAWTVTSYLAVPILVAEKRGPIDAFKESARLLKQSWGEQLIGNFGFGLMFLLLNIPAVLIFLLGIYLGGETAFFTFTALAVTYTLLLAVIQSALQAIFQAAVYQYASGGKAPTGFDTDTLAHSIQPR